MPVGVYAARLRERLRGFTRVQVFGEVFGFKAGRAKVWFELRDGSGALPCSMWREDFEALGHRARRPTACRSSSPAAATTTPARAPPRRRSRSRSPTLRVAGEGDLLAQLERLRRALHAEGLFEPQKRLPRPLLPRTIGVVCGEHGKARDDIVAGLRRRGWGGRVVWAFAPVQDRHAAPAITRALQDLAACAEVEAIVVARGGGSLADLFAFCDETLCRTVALLRVPVIASVGHHTDRTLLDDVAAVVVLDADARRRGRRAAGLRAARGALAGHARAARAPGPPGDRRARPHAGAALARAGRARRAPPHAPAPAAARAARQRPPRAWPTGRPATGAAAALSRAPGAAIARPAGAPRRGRRRGARRVAELTPARDLDRLAVALAAHDPQRTLERGYALVEDGAGEPVTSAAVGARAALPDPAPARRPRPGASGAARTLNRPMAEADTLTYEAACERMEAIIARLDSGEAGLRETLELCQEGRRLVEFCAAELDAVGHGLEELRLDELVARLERP